MINRLGYACINTHLKPRTFKDCRLNSIYKKDIDYLKFILIDNLNFTKEILKWNIKHNILMYRATSKLLPLVTHPDIVNDFSWRWYEDQHVLTLMEQIKTIVNENNIRLSTHPDQFTVINSINPKVIDNSIINLNFHNKLLDKLGGTDIIIHTGGVYNDKEQAIKRFVETYNTFDISLKQKLRLENDDVSYDIKDVLYISEHTGIPIILDFHHHNILNKSSIDLKSILPTINKTWNKTNLIPKFHISSGKHSPSDRKHHDFILKEDYNNILTLSKEIDFDLMVEAKSKECAVLKLTKQQ